MKDENLNLNELITNAEVDIKVVKLNDSVEGEKDKIEEDSNVKENSVEDTSCEMTVEEDIRDKREKALLKLKEYEDITSDINKLNLEREDILSEIRESCPELVSKLEENEAITKLKNDKLKIIASEALPFFRIITNYDENNKTLIYGKVQGTYVYPSVKHQFDLKSFIEEEKDFYVENISMFDPYSKITDVSDYVKFTVKKAK